MYRGYIEKMNKEVFVRRQNKKRKRASPRSQDVLGGGAIFDGEN